VSAIQKSEQKTKKAQKGESKDEDGVSINHIRVKLIGATHCEQMGMFQYDTATTHHYTN